MRTMQTSCERATGSSRGCIPLLATFALAASLVWCAQVAIAIPADPSPIELQQPDGAPITLYLRGDERFHWYEDVQGYTVVRSQDAYCYAELGPDGQLRPTAHWVGKVDPAEAGLMPRTLPSRESVQYIRSKVLKASPKQGEKPPSTVPPHGTVKNLVVLCRFSDHSVSAHTRMQSDYNTLFNAVGGHPTLAPTGSVRDLYYEDSYGQMTLVSTVVPWITLPQTEGYYAAGYSGLGDYPENGQGMVEDALNEVDAYVDFGEFDADNDGYVDAITFIHSGYGDESSGSGYKIWSHQWSLWALSGGKWTSQDRNGAGEFVKVYDYHTEPALRGTSGQSIVRFAVIAHETGHFFGLPDLYDTEQTSEGIGSYCMMSNSWGFDGSQLHPPHFSAWCKTFLGWLQPTVIERPGIYTAPQVETIPTVYRVDFNYPSGEYLLIENREPVGHESVMPQGGLCIWHIDESKYDNTEPGYVGQSGWPQNNKHYKVALLQADGDYALERGWNRGDAGDVYHGGGVHAINETTIPNTNAYQNGHIITTHNAITNIGPAGSSMQFTFGAYVDCNGNGTNDFDDVDGGASIDCNNNVIPDECEADCNGNGIHDDCDVASGFADDCQGDGIPDDCQLAGTDLPFAEGADNCWTAMSVTTGVQYSGKTNGVNSDGEADCGDSEDSPDVWYRYVAASNGPLTISLCGSGYDTVLSVHSACPGTGDNELACNDDACDVQSAVTLVVREDAEYYIRVSGWRGSAGSYVMTLDGPPGKPSATDCNFNGRPDACEDLLPRISRHPSDVLVAVGQPAEFSVEADGLSVSYQWQHEGKDIPGATQAVLRIEQVEWSDVGSYSVKVLSPCGNTVSLAATLTVKLGLFVDVDGGGHVDMLPPGGVYGAGTVVALTPVPDEGWRFLEWSGFAQGDSNPIYVRVLANENVGARFVPIHNLLTIVKDGEGDVSATPSGGDYTWGQQIRLRATPAAGWRFAGWQNVPTGGSSAAVTVTMEGDQTLVAKFEQIPTTEKPADVEQPIVTGMCGNIGPAMIPLVALMLGIAPLLRRRR